MKEAKDATKRTLMRPDAISSAEAASAWAMAVADRSMVRMAGGEPGGDRSRGRTRPTSDFENAGVRPEGKRLHDRGEAGRKIGQHSRRISTGARPTSMATACS
jgi:hypothetical protein